MFTGIITDIGIVIQKTVRTKDAQFRIRTRYDLSKITLGDSIACSGACLTVVEKGSDWFAVDVSAETLRCTTLDNWQEGTQINLELALRAGDLLGGHLVSGHVDGVATLRESRKEGESTVLVVEIPTSLARYVAIKGSITLDGVSLTVNQVAADSLSVNIIPHTQQVTTLGALKPGDKLNIEVDTIARYVARLLGKD